MELFNFNPFTLNLQLFAEGGTGAVGTGDGATGVTGTAAESTKVNKNPLANVKYGVQTDTKQGESVVTEPNTDRNAKFEELIKGEYKDLYDARMQDTIQKRLKGTKETVDKYNALTPTLELLAKKYGVDASDINALNRAIEDDDSYFEEEALEKGVTVEHLKEVNKLKKENENFRREQEARLKQEKADELYSKLVTQEKQVKEIYPNFNLNSELQNENFKRLLSSGIDVKTAFEVIHKDEIMPAAMQYTAKLVEQKVANNIRANGMRPSENGISSQGASEVKSDITKTTKADRDEIARRVARGEKISFG